MQSKFYDNKTNIEEVASSSGVDFPVECSWISRAIPAIQLNLHS